MSGVKRWEFPFIAHSSSGQFSPRSNEIVHRAVQKRKQSALYFNFCLNCSLTNRAAKSMGDAKVLFNYNAPCSLPLPLNSFRSYPLCSHALLNMKPIHCLSWRPCATYSANEYLSNDLLTLLATCFVFETPEGGWRPQKEQTFPCIEDRATCSLAK